jgi:hypothetical protein
MSRSPLTLRLPDEIYEHVRRAAKGMKQPMENALVRIVQAATPSLTKVPAEYRAELEAMEDLGDEDLQIIAKSRLSMPQQRRLKLLLDKNQQGHLTIAERQALIGLRADADRLMIHRSYAYLLLKYRGRQVPSFGTTKQ